MRVVQANMIDLERFTFDWDLTFSVHFTNADGTVYGRYGSRSGTEAQATVSLDGLADSMRAVLALHEKYPANREALSAKRGEKARWARPIDMPAFSGRYKGPATNRESCIHCHQIETTHLVAMRAAKRPPHDSQVWPWPDPAVLGLNMDPTKAATVDSVSEGFLAARAGVRAGDRILRADGQPLVSIADLQWVLHRTRADKVSLEIGRGTETVSATIPLGTGWRRTTDLSWRSVNWFVGDYFLGFHARPVPTEEATAFDVPAGAAAYHIDRLTPEWLRHGYHGARKIGLKAEDVLVAVDGKPLPGTFSGFLGWVLAETRRGQEIRIDLVRRGQKMTKMLTLN